MKIFKWQLPTPVKRYLFLTIALLLISSNSYASELAELGDAIFNLFVGLLLFIVGTIFMFWFFRKDSFFILFSICNLLFFCSILILIFAVAGESDIFFTIFTVFILGSIFAQIIVIIKAYIKKFNSDSIK